jgi:hypothetical protein
MSISRKDFLKSVGMLSVAGIATSALVACGGGSDDKKPAKKADPCKDTSGLSQDELNKRTTFKYVEASADPAKICANCALYKSPAAGSACGGCTLFAGPVTEKGYCTAWAAKPANG